MGRMCSMCRQVKSEAQFYYHKKSDRYSGYCSNCYRLYQKEYRRIYNLRKRTNEQELMEE